MIILVQFFALTFELWCQWRSSYTKKKSKIISKRHWSPDDTGTLWSPQSNKILLLCMNFMNFKGFRFAFESSTFLFLFFFSPSNVLTKYAKTVCGIVRALSPRLFGIKLLRQQGSRDLCVFQGRRFWVTRPSAGVTSTLMKTKSKKKIRNSGHWGWKSAKIFLNYGSFKHWWTQTH